MNANKKAEELLDPKKYYGSLWDEKRREIAEALEEVYEEALEEEKAGRGGTHENND